MKKWQKIIGVFVFVAIGFILSLSFIEFDAYYMSQDFITNDNRRLWNAKPYIFTLMFLLVILYFIAIALYIYHWHKNRQIALSNIFQLKKKLRNLGIDDREYAFNDISQADSTVLYRNGKQYQIIYVDDRGGQTIIASFTSETKACNFMFGYFQKSKEIKRKYRLSD